MARLRRIRRTSGPFTGRHACCDLRSADRRVAATVPGRGRYRHGAAGNRARLVSGALGGDRRVTDVFAGELTQSVRERIVAVVAANLLWEQPAAVAAASRTRWRRAGVGTSTLLSTARFKPHPKVVQGARLGGGARQSGATPRSSISCSLPTPRRNPRRCRRTSGRRWVGPPPGCLSSARSSRRWPRAPMSQPRPTMSDRCSRPAGWSRPSGIERPRRQRLPFLDVGLT